MIRTPAVEIALVLTVSSLAGCGLDQAPTGEGFVLGDSAYELTELVARLREDEQSVSLFGISGIARTPEGFLVTDTRNQRLVALGQDLRFLRTIGGPGEGPGEYGMPTKLVRTAEHIVVLDEGHGRASYLEPDGSFARSEPISGNPTDMVLHPTLGLMANGGMIHGHQLDYRVDHRLVGFGPVPAELTMYDEGSLLLSNSRTAVTPDGSVHVLDAQAFVLVSYGPDGVLSHILPLPEPMRRDLIEKRAARIEDFGGAGWVIGLSFFRQLTSMDDGRLLLLGRYDDWLGVVLDPQTRVATPILIPGDGDWGWLEGASAGLFDDGRLVLTHLTEVSIIETALVSRSSGDH